MNRRYAKDIQVTKLVTLPPHADVFDAIQLLLKRHITGAPVIDETGRLLGVFSDKSCMTVLAAALSQDVDLPTASNVMVKRVMTVTPETDAFEAIGRLLKKGVSGAPVIDNGKFVGVFSERYAMRVLVGSAYDQLPSLDVGQHMNTDSGRTIAGDLDMQTMVQMFVDNYFRRLCVLRNDKLVGQISRRDVIHMARKQMAVTDLWRDAIRDYVGSREEYRNTPRKEASMVSTFMNKTLQTINEETDFLSIAQVFLNTNNRRLPVVRGGKLIGQISRRDLLQAVYEMTAVHPKHESPLLYLSALVERGDAPIDS
jgi:CBS domain-containing protein